MLPKQFRIHAVLIVACIFMILYPLYSDKPDAEKVEQAQPVANAFLAKLDDGKFVESWQGSAALMKDKITQQEWVEKLTKARELSGDLVQRERKSSTYATKIEDSPEGEYIMLIYDSSFKKADDVSEYVTVMLEGEQWKVAGYFMQ